MESRPVKIAISSFSLGTVAARRGVCQFRVEIGCAGDLVVQIEKTRVC